MRQDNFSVGPGLFGCNIQSIRAPLPSADAATPGSERPGPEGIAMSFWWPKRVALHQKPSRN